jgi:hypothetical protein
MHRRLLQPRMSGGMRMTAVIQLLRIEVRRSVALWFVPPLAVLVGWSTLATMRPDNAPTLWERSSTQLGLAFVVVAFVMCGVGAWAAGRDRRRRIEDLLATTPRPAPLRDLALVTGTAAWGLVACFAGGAYIFVVSYREATWGGPGPAPIVIGLLTVVAGTAVGHLGGTLIPSRFAAPLLAVALSAATIAVGARSSSIAYLSPTSLDPRSYSPYDVFFRPPPFPALQMSLWLAGVTGCALALIALRRRRSVVALGAFAAALVAATGGAMLVTQAFVHPPWERTYIGQPLVAYEPVCVQRSIQVCVHPAYEVYLDDYADRISRLVEPLVGIPGGPARVEQLPARVGLRPDGTLEILPGVSFTLIAYDLVHDAGTDLNAAQIAIAYWLMDRAGEDAFDLHGLFGPGQPDAAVAAAFARFGALPPDEQRRWLIENFQALRAGDIDIGDLP